MELPAPLLPNTHVASIKIWKGLLKAKQSLEASVVLSILLLLLMKGRRVGRICFAGRRSLPRLPSSVLRACSRPQRCAHTRACRVPRRWGAQRPPAGGTGLWLRPLLPAFAAARLLVSHPEKHQCRKSSPTVTESLGSKASVCGF